jgi:Mn2+/Fe2+ NRAMP family transporter
VTVCTAFFAVLFKGPVEKTAELPHYSDLLAGSGLALMVSLIGFMPTGLEASVMHSIWSVEKIIVTGYRPTLKETLFDFNLGYVFTSLLAFMFLVIGAFTVYGSGQLLEGNSTQFSNRLLTIFTTNLGAWTRPVIALAAFGTIYGTLITAWDAFTRSFVRCLQVLKYRTPERNEEQQRFLNSWYNVFLVIIGTGGFILFFQFSGGMIKVLEAATISVFLSAPVIAFLNLRVILHPSIPASHRPSKALVFLAGVGMVALAAFALYYLRDIIR